MLLNKELTTNGKFDDWTGSYPDWWAHTYNDAHSEISQVDPDEGHGGAGTTGGACNIWTDDETNTRLRKPDWLTIGKTYCMVFEITKFVSGILQISLGGVSRTFSAEGKYTFGNKAISRNLEISRWGNCDITIDNISIREDIPTELSRTGHRFSSFPEN